MRSLSLSIKGCEIAHRRPTGLRSAGYGACWIVVKAASRVTSSVKRSSWNHASHQGNLSGLRLGKLPNSRERNSVCQATRTEAPREIHTITNPSCGLCTAGYVTPIRLSCVKPSNLGIPGLQPHLRAVYRSGISSRVYTISTTEYHCKPFENYELNAYGDG